MLQRAETGAGPGVGLLKPPRLQRSGSGSELPYAPGLGPRPPHLVLINPLKVHKAVGGGGQRDLKSHGCSAGTRKGSVVVEHS